MIAGLLLRNFKTYKAVNFIPFLKDEVEHLNIFIGNNGTGKSSILEALNAYFNDGKWIPTTSQTDVYVAPLLLLEKNKYLDKFTPETKELIEKISTFYWDFTSNSNPVYESLQGFIAFKDGIKLKYQQTHHLLLLGKHYTDRKNLFFATFQPEIIKLLGYKINKDGELSKNDQKLLNKIFQELDEIITFIYVPAETDISQFLKLNSDGMQDLVNKNIKDEIELILTKDHSINGTTQTQKNIVELINDELIPHVDNIQKTIKTIDPAYKFNAGTRSKELSPKDLIAPIIQAFYLKRRLEKNNKPIDDWSSGERKKALVDIVFSFLSQPGVQEKDIIFAIDEPESSLDTDNKYDSFDRVEKISNTYFHQTFITTHWYGLLPIIQKGLIHCLESPKEDDIKPVVINYYDAKNFISERRKETDDNYFKSFSDLASSIVSSIRAKEINWIIVEGADDRNYLDYYLKHLIEGYNDRFRILSVGGKGEVKLLYEHLFIPIKHIKPEKLLGKVLCIVDTDEQVLKLEPEFQPINLGSLVFKRLQLIDESIKLVNIPEKNHTQKTTIEDTLEAKKFYESLKIVIDNCGDQNIIKAFQNFKFYDRVKLSRIDSDRCILAPEPKETTDIIQDKETIKDFVNRLSSKWKISCEYYKQTFVDEDVPEWIREYLLKKCFYPETEIPYISKTKKNATPTPLEDGAKESVLV